ncbi:MAG: hypothetical protein JXR56_06405 [Candidatus Cloacimonetes bacterium]|nr:hypothetical protein [Candidatus Cloacimonadota bacterium]
MNKIILPILFVLLTVISLSGLDKGEYIWLKLDNAIYYSDMEMPEESFVNDSKVTVIKIDPLPYQLKPVMADKTGSKRLEASRWASLFNLVVVSNACFFKEDGTSPEGYLQIRKNVRKRFLNPDMSMMILFEPWDENDKQYNFVLTTDPEYKETLKDYKIAVQGIGLIHEGTALPVPVENTASFSAVGLDGEGNILFFFSRSPYDFEKIGSMLLCLSLDIQELMLTGKGSEATLYFENDASTIRKIGSYELGTYISDDNNKNPRLPVIMGIRRKTL